MSFWIQSTLSPWLLLTSPRLKNSTQSKPSSEPFRKQHLSGTFSYSPPKRCFYSALCTFNASDSVPSTRCYLELNQYSHSDCCWILLLHSGLPYEALFPKTTFHSSSVIFGMFKFLLHPPTAHSKLSLHCSALPVTTSARKNTLAQDNWHYQHFPRLLLTLLRLRVSSQRFTLRISTLVCSIIPCLPPLTKLNYTHNIIYPLNGYLPQHPWHSINNCPNPLLIFLVIQTQYKTPPLHTEKFLS